MKDAFDGLISRFAIAKKRLTERADKPTHTFQTEMQRQKASDKNRTELSRPVGQFQKVQCTCN